MALIKCPECGREVSDKAKACPVCGFPISQEQDKGKIRIKLGMFRGVGGNQEVTITSGSETIWQGRSGEVAAFEIAEKTDITINYALNPMHYSGSCNATIDPEKSNKYAVSARAGFFKTALTFQTVDFIDSE